MKDIFNPGLFEPRINEGKELAIMEKYNTYSAYLLKSLNFVCL